MGSSGNTNGFGDGFMQKAQSRGGRGTLVQSSGCGTKFAFEERLTPPRRAAPAKLGRNAGMSKRGERNE